MLQTPVSRSWMWIISVSSICVRKSLISPALASSLMSSLLSSPGETRTRVQVYSTQNRSFCCCRHGPSLVSINFAEVEAVEVGTLCDNCPSLVHLALLWNKSYISREGEICKREWFPKLQTIDMAYANFNEDNFDYVPIEVPTHNLLQILRSPKLKSIQICASRNLTSECMESVFAFNDLGQLEFLELNKCHEVSFESLEQLLEEENKLNHVRVLKCDQITKRDIQFYQKKCKKWRWNVNIEWT